MEPAARDSVRLLRRWTNARFNFPRFIPGDGLGTTTATSPSPANSRKHVMESGLPTPKRTILMEACRLYDLHFTRPKFSATMLTMPDNSIADDRRKIVPLLAFSAFVLGVTPWFHPANTCRDWLMKWGQLSSDPIWLPIHQFAMAGFMIMGGAALLFPLLGKRSTAAVTGGASLGVGGMLTGGNILIHASAVS